MTALAKAIQERLGELGWQQKMLAHEWCQRVGKGSGATYETRLSKLVNDDQEGYDFVLDDKEDRLSALAGVLDWTPEKLRSLIDAALVSTTLVLHPKLPEAVSAFLLKRQESGAYKCTLADGAGSNGGVREVLKDAAKSARNAFVVIPDSSRDHDFFEGAGIRTTRVEPANPGYKLVALPDLIQPLAPKLHDDDGMPMVPDQAIEQSYRESLNPASRDPYGPMDGLVSDRVRTTRVFAQSAMPTQKVGLLRSDSKAYSVDTGGSRRRSRSRPAPSKTPLSVCSPRGRKSGPATTRTRSAKKNRGYGPRAVPCSSLGPRLRR